ncbi:glucose-6-phosphate isomerase [Blochmannia endosymbiont of Camponotus modoc]|uniref:glucose-6-phosphate isomerase n=1 Tax=Blochmannia endosymbiont of Camponotus modoc TaxID=2945587 RepID=UPI002024AB43|nr:glucose-6-phosphate isomerase [Blochmannia endosymbiont of Camponotus modoc]URJ31772.1 glucose-6-phosphate isomerase [Blochmannia endosymbiont of Camponotus modoc]
MKNINPISTQAWQHLKQHFNDMKSISINDLFNQDKYRFAHFSKTFNNEILVDYSKNLITNETIIKLISLAIECDLIEAISDMFHGEKINRSEDRAALHIALRNIKNTPILVDGSNVMPQINAVLNKMKQFCNRVIQGNWTGYTDKIITDIVNIGIGGSNLGPYMVTEALKPYRNHLNMHFVSNIDGTHIFETLKNLNPENTLFVIASKTFTTQETMTNAFSARNWFCKATSNAQHVSKHFIALSTNTIEVRKFGIDPSENMFKFWDWVGGRYSLWSSIGLPIMLSVGVSNFELLLTGAHDMDMHFHNTPLHENLPVILALIGIWYNNFFQVETEAIFPYDQYMHRFTAYLQQVNMESNGKCVDRNGCPIIYQTGPIIWGEPGTNGQHSFYQLLHQGTKMVPCDFIAPAISHNPMSDHHEKLISNFFAQTKALAFGNTRSTAMQKYVKFKKNYKYEQCVVPFKLCKGNNPSNSILVKKITPYTLGALIALYEHKIFTQGIIFNIYTFDQWGVELGKQLADSILPELKYENMISKNHDSSTYGLIDCYKSWRS